MFFQDKLIIIHQIDKELNESGALEFHVPLEQKKQSTSDRANFKAKAVSL